MSCKLWLNVWTCRSFTCPFTLRNLDRNPTAALISGFIVPRAQRVCIEKGDGDGPRAFVVISTCLSDCSSPLRRDPYLLALVFCLLAFICRGRGQLSHGECQDGSVLGFGRLFTAKYRRLCVVLREEGGGSFVATPIRPSLFTVLLQSEPLGEWETGFMAPPPLPAASTQAATATTARQSQASLPLTSHM